MKGSHVKCTCHALMLCVSISLANQMKPKQKLLFHDDIKKNQENKLYNVAYPCITVFYRNNYYIILQYNSLQIVG